MDLAVAGLTGGLAAWTLWVLDVAGLAGGLAVAGLAGGLTAWTLGVL